MNKVLAALGLILFSSSVHANLLFEPSVGGQFNGGFKAAKFESNSFSSFVYGGRVGYDYSGFLLGGEYLGASGVSMTIETPNTIGTNVTRMKMDNQSYGAFLGWDMTWPVEVRLIGTYFIKSTAHFTHSTEGTNDVDQLDSGTGFKVELTSRIARHLTMGVAYYQMKYTKQKDNVAGKDILGMPSDTQSAVMGVLTVPLEF
jgi:hypothetical protein